MQFKVGDRVEVLTPAEGVGKEFSNEVGVGTIKAIGNDLSVKVELPGNFHSWWYKPEQLRHAIEEIEIHPTLSITVGTQVRLTGVTMSSGKDGEVVTIESDGFVFGVPVGALEVIRQPFKRGEVVYFEDHGIACVVLEDEQNGRMLLIEASEGKYATYVDAANYQRRPSRPKEER